MGIKFDKPYSAVEFTKQLSETYDDLRKKRALTEQDEYELQESYNKFVDDTMIKIESLIKKNSILLRRQLKEQLRVAANENASKFNVTKRSLHEDLTNEYVSRVSANVAGIISETIIEG